MDWSETQAALSLNQEKHALQKDGVPVSFRDGKGELVKQWLRVFDFGQPERNHFLAVRELWIRGGLYRRRADIVGFVNGIPLLFMELKNIHKDIHAAYENNLADYRDTVPYLFHHNEVQAPPRDLRFPWNRYLPGHSDLAAASSAGMAW